MNMKMLRSSAKQEQDSVWKSMSLFYQKSELPNKNQYAAAVNRFVTGKNGGSLTASSAGAGRGSEFTLRLPRAASAPAAVGALAEPDRVSALGAHARRLLVVDDNVDAADSLAQMLRLAGFETRVAYDGRTALEIAELMHPDVALLDLGLPLLSGYDVARRLRGETWGRDLRLIAVTGWGQEGDRARSRDAGFDEHLTKPVDPEVLIEAILHETTPAPSASVAGG